MCSHECRFFSRPLTPHLHGTRIHCNCKELACVSKAETPPLAKKKKKRLKFPTSMCTQVHKGMYIHVHSCVGTQTQQTHLQNGPFFPHDYQELWYITQYDEHRAHPRTWRCFGQRHGRDESVLLTPTGSGGRNPATGFPVCCKLTQCG